MSNEVFANGREISCKSGDGKSICEFPDVCMTPPTSPATPLGVPVPYPNTGFSRDTTKGSKTVKIDKKEVMLRNKSYYKTSTGDEAGCATPAKKGIITGTTKGKIYFISWSQDVKIEGENVVRTSDMTTHNHASYPGNGSIPTADVEGVKKALKRLRKLCPCCGGEKHAIGEDMHLEEWYDDVLVNQTDKLQKEKWRNGVKIQEKIDIESRRAELKELLYDATDTGRRKKGCRCSKKKPKTKLLPKPPCDVFFKKNPADPKRAENIDAEWRKFKPIWDKKNKIPLIEDQENPESRKAEKERSGNHLVPKSAGGCPGNIKSDANLQAYHKLCEICQGIDDRFDAFQ